MKERQGTWLGQGAILCCAILWSTSGLFIKLLNWHPLLIAGGRSAIAALFLFTIRRVRLRIGAVPPPSSRFPVILAGSLAYAATMISFVWANKLTTSANAILLQYTAPVWAALLGWRLIGEKPRWFHWAALALVLGGLCVFFREDLRGGAFGRTALGDLVALASGLFFGAHSVFLRMQRRGNPVDSMLGAHLICAAAAIPFFFIFPPGFNSTSLGAMGFMGLIQIGLASQLFAFGIRRVQAMQALLIAMIEPVLNPLWVFAFTGERPSPAAFAGGLVIILAVLFSSVLGVRYPLRNESPKPLRGDSDN
ncbi:MAG: DMT family transporter [Treponema sp.]|jgi:drug/metabolite transporter (DMT)-like permease|nr:DMT family transporter [Treponema sp.]